MICHSSRTSVRGESALARNGDWKLVTLVSRYLQILLRLPSRPHYNQLSGAWEMCLWPARGDAANVNRSLTIPELERKRADLRPANPANLTRRHRCAAPKRSMTCIES